MQNIPAIRIGGQITKSAYQYTLQGTDTDAAVSVGAENRGRSCDRFRALVGVTSDLQIAKPHGHRSQIDRNKASALGVSAQAIENTLYDAYGQRQVSTIYRADQSVLGRDGIAATLPDRTPRRCRCSTCDRRAGALVPLSTASRR